jgi:hypothetical protein
MVFIASILVPGSGLVLLGKAGRGLMYLVWMVFFGYLTYRYTSPHISLIGRLSGGIAVWTLSLVEVYRLLKSRKD